MENLSPSYNSFVCFLKAFEEYGLSSYRFDENFIQLVSQKVLNGEIEIWEMPFTFRIMSRSIYIYSLRRYRNNKTDKYKHVLSLLKEDLDKSDDMRVKSSLQRLYDDYYLRL